VKNIILMFVLIFSILNANDKGIKKAATSRDIKVELSELLSGPFYRKDSEQIKEIYNIYLKKTNIIAFEYYDNQLEKNIYSMVKQDGKNIFKFSLLSNEIYKKSAEVQTIPISYNNLNIGFLFIYYENKLGLTKEEKKYLKKKSNINVCIQKSNMPYEDIVENNLVGINSDILNKIKQDLNISISLVEEDSYKNKLKSLSLKKCDMVFGVVENNNKNILLSQVYLKDYMAVATLLDKAYLKSISAVATHSLGLISKKEYEKNKIMSIYNNKLNFYIYDDIDNGISDLKKGKIYGLFGSSNNLAYSIKKRYFKTVKLNGYFKDIGIQYHIGIDSSEPLLLSSVNKVLNTYSDEQILNITSKWINVDHNKNIDWDLIKNILIVMIIVAIFLIYRHYVLHESNKRLKEEVKKELEKNIKKDKIIAYQTRLAIMGEMLNNIAHQWRQPLNEINSVVMTIDYTMMKEKFFSKEIESQLQSIENQTQYMSNTIDDFRNYFNPNKEKVNFTFNELIDKSLNIFSGIISKYNINVEKIVYNDKKYYNYMSELIQIVITILNNAKDVLVLNKINDPKIIIKIDYGIITIEDNGGGIEDEYINKIFDPYFTTKSAKKGTGIGLYLCKMIVEDSLNGTISVENTDHGAKFIIKLNKEKNE